MKPCNRAVRVTIHPLRLVLMRNWSNRATLAKIPVIPGTPAVRMKK
jgi:hypothetical protein